MYMREGGGDEEGKAGEGEWGRVGRRGFEI